MNSRIRLQPRVYFLPILAKKYLDCGRFQHAYSPPDLPITIIQKPYLFGLPPACDQGKKIAAKVCDRDANSEADMAVRAFCR
jgi:hypothetical protein